MGGWETIYLQLGFLGQGELEIKVGKADGEEDGVVGGWVGG